MKVMVIVKATADTEAGVMPTEAELAAMGAYNERLVEAGFGKIEVTRTLLGRVRIVGTKGKVRRELVINPRTGEILRDVTLSRRPRADL